LGLVLAGLFLLVQEVSADTIYLKNGRKIEGIIVSETEGSYTIHVGFGRMEFAKSEIERVVRSDPQQAKSMQDKWESQRQESAKRKDVPFTQENGQIVVAALLNQDVNVNLILDTGASMVVISNSVAQKLGIDTGALKENLKMILADGKEGMAKHAVLDKISVNGIEADNVDVAILSPEVTLPPAVKDGLLGMTFLKNFSFKIDPANKRLILEKLH
jgi:clan AA aspartic protease (TIGR02281 family)